MKSKNSNTKKINIGTDYVGTSAGAVIFDDDKKLFLVQRGIGARDDIGKWEFPGGKINMFESREDAAIRNISEKYVITIEIVKLLGVYDVIDEKQGDHWISTTYICKYLPSKPKIIFPEKCKNLGWFTLEEVNKMNLSRISKLNLNDLEQINFLNTLQ